MSDLAELLARLEYGHANYTNVGDVRALLREAFQHIAAEPTRIRAAVEAERGRAADGIARAITGRGE